MVLWKSSTSMFNSPDQTTNVIKVSASQRNVHAESRREGHHGDKVLTIQLARCQQAFDNQRPGSAGGWSGDSTTVPTVCTAASAFALARARADSYNNMNCARITPRSKGRHIRRFVACRRPKRRRLKTSCKEIFFQLPAHTRETAEVRAAATLFGKLEPEKGVVYIVHHQQ